MICRKIFQPRPGLHWGGEAAPARPGPSFWLSSLVSIAILARILEGSFHLELRSNLPHIVLEHVLSTVTSSSLQDFYQRRYLCPESGNQFTTLSTGSSSCESNNRWWDDCCFASYYLWFNITVDHNIESSQCKISNIPSRILAVGSDWAQTLNSSWVFNVEKMISKQPREMTESLINTSASQNRPERERSGQQMKMLVSLVWGLHRTIISSLIELNNLQVKMNSNFFFRL